MTIQRDITKIFMFVRAIVNPPMIGKKRRNYGSSQNMTTDVKIYL
jgi:hypothetical protein